MKGIGGSLSRLMRVESLLVRRAPSRRRGEAAGAALDRGGEAGGAVWDLKWEALDGLARDLVLLRHGVRVHRGNAWIALFCYIIGLGHAGGAMDHLDAGVLRGNRLAVVFVRTTRNGVPVTVVLR